MSLISRFAVFCFTFYITAVTHIMVTSSLTSEAAKTLVHAFVSSCLQRSTVWDQWRPADETPDCPERSSVCRDRNREVWPHYSSAASTPLTSDTAVNHLQVGNDHLQMPSRSGTELPGWRVYPSFVHWDSVTLVMPGTRTTIIQRDFAVSSPATWNSLPV